LQAKEVKESTILAESVGVVWVVETGFAVALNNYKTVFYVFTQLFSASYVCFFAKHNSCILLNKSKKVCGTEKRRR
jgi:hypothetical protein